MDNTGEDGFGRLRSEEQDMELLADGFFSHSDKKPELGVDLPN